MDRHTLMYLKWITNKVLLYYPGNSAQCFVAAWMGAELGGEWIHVYVWQSDLKCLVNCAHLIVYM